jgi:hypothetical protein
VKTIAIATVAWGSNRLDIFGLGTDNQMYHKAWDGNAWLPSLTDWEPLGGVFNSPPAVASWGSNRLDIFGLGTDNQMYHKAWNGNAWLPSVDGWDALGGVFNSPPAVASWGANRLDIFGLGTDNQMYHKAWNGNAWLPSVDGWDALGGVFNIPSPSTSGLVSFRSPDGLILSTGNLYFTSHDDATASVWRAAQSALPGQEILLYSEPGAIFGDIVFAQVDGTWWGYFFADVPGPPVTTIKRVPLTGGAATVLGTVTDVDVANSHRNLVTDGVNLYWQDVHSVRKMPIRGGAVTVLDQATPNTPTAGLALQNGNIIYASVAAIRYVPTSGATTPPSARTIVTASDRVTALHAVLGFVYWGEEGGSIRVVTSGSTPVTLASVAGVPTSISTSVRGGVYAQAWTLCDSQSCQLHFDIPSGESSMYKIGGNAFGVSVTSSGSVFWGDATGVHRHIPH